MSGLVRLIAVLLWGLLPAAPAGAHALQPGYLEISEIAEDSYRVFWRVPDVQGRPMEIAAVLPQSCDVRRSPDVSAGGGAWSAAWVAACPGGLGGGDIRIEGLEHTDTDVLVRYPAPGGEMHSARLTASATTFTVPRDPGKWDVLRSYFGLGVEHILKGFDHLLFVFALLLLIRSPWRLAGAVTAFTVAHSITMAAATLGLVSLPGPPVEAVIALSIMFVASELVQRERGRERLSERYPWTVSFTFGLLHGFGFAGALAEIGLPQSEIPLALLSFNLGVEAGQLLFVGAVLACAFLLRLALPRIGAALAAGSRAMVLGAYAIGGISAFWFIERVTGF